MMKISAVIPLIILGACSEIPATESRPIVETAEAAAPPVGFNAYCRSSAGRATAAEQRFHDAFCRLDAPASVVPLTAERAHELVEVQQNVNAAIAYRSTGTWNPLASEGDCKTYAARKELELLERGWPAGAMRIVTAFVDDGSRQQFFYHAVLLVQTDRGTLALDSRRRRPSWWDELPYIWMTAQARGDSAHWVRLAADPAAVTTALAAYARNGRLADRTPDFDGLRFASRFEPLAAGE
jgi:predicted transglutaminase-like cysteine proteinase